MDVLNITGAKTNQVRPDRFLASCRAEPVDTTPVWLMRQAGRYLPEYRSLREKQTLLEMVNNPELAAEVTLQPLRRFDLDAAIIFSDLLPPLGSLGFALEFVAGEGPLIHNPVRTAAEIDRLTERFDGPILPGTCDAIRMVVAELQPRGIPLIGFAGAPFTLASYAIEGGPNKTLARTKSVMFSEPTAWHTLMSLLVDLSVRNIREQVAAGVEAVQIFDSWAGELAPIDYRAHVLPHTLRLIEAIRPMGVPIIHFATGVSAHLGDFAALPIDVLGIDWRIDLNTAITSIPTTMTVQGNLDPVTLFGPTAVLRQRASEIVRLGKSHPGHIFNLGHGVLPNTPIDNVARLVDVVHEAGRR